MAPQQHLDPLSALDAAFLLQEGPTTHMHIGGVAIFRGKPPPFDDFLAHIRGRLDRAPRYRQKLAYPPAGIGRPRWIDDPRFNLEYHVRNASLPQPGSDEQLRKLVGADLLRAPGPHQAAVGAAARRGPLAAGASRSSPRPTTRSSTASAASTSRPRSSTSSPRSSSPTPRRAPGSRSPSPRRPSSPRSQSPATRARSRRCPPRRSRRSPTARACAASARR